MLSTELCEEMKLTIAPEFSIPMDPEGDDASESTDADSDEEQLPPWEQLFGNGALSLTDDGRKSSEDDDDADPEFEELGGDSDEAEEFDGEEFEDDDDLEEDLDDFEFDEEEEEEEDL